jgi:uncharacterized SAM-binding protein YcdF (DUF218 family)
MRVMPRSWPGRLLAVVVALVLVVLGATALLFLFPSTNAPTHVDAVVALGGDPGQRRAHKAMDLVQQGYASTAVISLGGEPGHVAPCPRPVAGVQVICFRAEPLDTRGEAEYVAALAARRHWDTLIVVSEHSQVTRARLLFERCTTSRLYMVPVGDPLPRLPFDVLYEWGALLKALVLVRSC